MSSRHLRIVKDDETPVLQEILHARELLYARITIIVLIALIIGLLFSWKWGVGIGFLLALRLVKDCRDHRHDKPPGDLTG